MAKFVSAYESADLDALVGLLTDDVFMSMPPLPFEYLGREAVAGFAAARSVRAEAGICAYAGQWAAGVGGVPAGVSSVGNGAGSGQ